MDHPMLDRMQAFILRNERKSTEDSPYLHEHSNSQGQSFCYNQLSERNGSSQYDIQLSTPVNHRKSTSSNYSYDGFGRAETPQGNLPNYVYQYGKAHPFLHKLPGGTSNNIHLQTASSIDFSPANKENSISLFEKSMGSATTPTKRKISTPLSQASNSKRTNYSPAQSKTVSSFRVPMSEKKTSYVEQQTKFYDKIKNAARRDVSKAFKSRVSTPSPSRNAIPRLDITQISNANSKCSQSSRETSIERKNVGNVTFDNIKVKPNTGNNYSHTKKDVIESLLKKNPKKVAVTQSKIATKPKSTKLKQEEFCYEENQAKSRSPVPGNRAARERSSSKKEIKKPQVKTPTKISQSKSVSRLTYESKKKLVTSESLAEIHESYKEEIKGLIKTIKTEKEQITSELEKMAKELKKYKKAYKKMKKEIREKKSEGDNSKPSLSRDSTERKDEIHQNENDFNDSINNDDNEEEPLNVVESGDMPLLIDCINDKCLERVESIKKEIEEPNIEKPQVDLLSQIQDLNKDVENILNGVRSDYSSSNDFKFKSPALLNCIINQLDIESKIFPVVPTQEEADLSKVDVRDIVMTQQQMIKFLVKKLQNEETQRLKTEEQAQEVINSMEKTIKNLEENKFVSRDRRRDNTPSALMESNKSFSSNIN